MRMVLAVLVLWLVSPPVALGVLPPFADDEGSAGSSCRWNPFAELVCGAGSCEWRGEFQWYTLIGDPTGEVCAK